VTILLCLVIPSLAADPVARLERARDRRDLLLQERARELLAVLDARLTGDVATTTADEAERWFAGRTLRGLVQQWWALSLLDPGATVVEPMTVGADHQAAYVEWLGAYAENTLRGNAEARSWARTHEGTPWENWSSYEDLPPEDQRRATELLGLGWEAGGRFAHTLHGEAEELVRITCLGEPRNLYLWRQGLSVRPTLLSLDPSGSGKVLEELQRAVEESARRKDDPLGLGPLRAVELIGLHGDCLSALGRREEALRTWQKGLDRFPTASGYEALERRVKQAL
jgi:hypothetical protein